jgi:pSer/pThr/pTyr-binding forkhead associated (FHA) protein
VRSGEVTLGRSNYASIVVNNPLASREHALIRPVNGKLELVDLGARNGTFLNGARIQGSAWLEPGDIVKIGTEAIEIVRVSIEDPSALRIPTSPGRLESPLEGETTVHLEKSLELAEALLASCTAEKQRAVAGPTIQQVLSEFLSETPPSTLRPKDVVRVRKITSALASWQLGATVEDWLHAVDADLPSVQISP